MRKVQLRWLVALAALVTVTILASGYLAERGLREREQDRITRSLEQRARLLLESIGDEALDAGSSRPLSELARRAAVSANARVTLISQNGAVVADSDVLPEDLPRVENHGDRPEVRGALEGRVATSRRLSETVGRSLLYLAVPGPGGGVVRLAVDLSEIEAAVWGLRRVLLIAGGIGLAAAFALSFGVSWLFVRPLTAIGSTVRSIAAGDLGRRVEAVGNDEVGDIARTVNRMGEELEARVAEITADREQLRAVLVGMVEGVLVLGGDDRVVLANPRLRQLFGSPEDVQGHSPTEVLRNPDAERLLREARVSGRPLLGEVDVTGSLSRTLRVHAASFLLGGNEQGVVAVFHDVTEIRRLDQVRRDFVANASHEIRTPLTAIRGFAETILTSKLSEAEAKSYLEVILQNAERLGALVDDLLELSRIETGRQTLETAELDLASIAREVLRDLEPRLEAGELTAEVDAAAPAPAVGDRRAVEQILRNLLDNAVKYSEPGGSIRVTFGEREGVRSAAVSDTGIGIPERDRERIFERFYRVDKGRSRALGGTGLGLSIVKHLVQSMGGGIRVTSELGAGSTFVFTLPSPEGHEDATAWR